MKSKQFLIMFLALVAGSIFAQSDFSTSATTISVNSTCVYQSGTTSNATQSIPPINCGYGASPTGLDVWYQFVAISTSGTIKITGSINHSPIIDLRGGTPPNSTYNIACAEDPTYNQPILNYTGLTVGVTYYIRVYHFGGYTDNFQICVTGTPTCPLAGVTPTLSSPGTTSSPGPTISNTTPTLSWNAVSGAAMYGVYVRDMISNTLVVNINCATSGTSYTIPSGTLSNGGQYRWAVVAYSSCNSTCQSNQATQFYFQTPGTICPLAGVTPTLSSPGTGSSPGITISTTTPTLSWNSVSGAGNYGVYIRDMGTNTLVVNNDCATSNTSYTVPSGVLISGGQYKWNIIAYQSCSNLGCATNAASPLYFNVQTTPPCVAVSVSVQPQNQTVCAGNTATFSVTAGGDAPFLYFWYKNGAQITGASNATYITPSLTSGDNGNTYYCIITNCVINGTSTQQAISNTVSLTVTSPPAVSATSNSPVITPNTINLTATAVSGATYSWTGPNSFTSAQQNPSISNTTTSMSGNYCVIVTLNGCAGAQSCTNVVVNSTPCIAVSITNTLSNQSALVNGNVTWTANTSGTAPFTYQWFKNGSAISGATNSSYTTPTLTLGDNNSTYYCYVTNCLGANNATSNTATLTVSTTCIGVSTNTLSNDTAMLGNTATFNASVNGTSPITYQWFKNGTQISGANNSSYSTPVLTMSDNGNTYYYYVTNCSNNNATSNTATLTVQTTTNINEQIGLTTLVIYPNPNKGLFTLSYEATGTEDLQIKVFDIKGETVYLKEYKKVNGKFSKEINLSNVANGIYSVEIKSGEKMYRQKLIKE